MLQDPVGVEPQLKCTLGKKHATFSSTSRYWTIRTPAQHEKQNKQNYDQQHIHTTHVRAPRRAHTQPSTLHQPLAPLNTQATHTLHQANNVSLLQT